MTKKGLASSFGLLVLLLARAAAAQSQGAGQGPEWLKDRKYTEGIGIRAGDLEVHPGISGDVGYDSNFFMRSTQANVLNGPPIIPSAVIRITPSLSLSTLSPQRREGEPVLPDVMFRLGVNATYRALFGLSSDASVRESDGSKPNDPSQDDALSGAADTRVDILPGKPLGAGFFGSYSRMIQPNTSNSDPNVSFNRDDFRVGGEIVIQPGGGTLDWRAGYEFDDTLFEASSGVPYDNYTQKIYTRGRWRFRPRTALVYDGSLDFYTFQNAQRAYDTSGLLSAVPVRARLGLDGLISEQFAAVAMLGWGASFINTAPLPQQSQYDSLLAQAELKWFLTPTPGVASPGELGLSLSSIALGFTRDFQTSYIGNYYGIDRGYLKFYYLFAGQALLSIDGGIGSIEYPEIWGAGGVHRSSSFTDLRADVSVLGEYRFTDTFAVDATFKYTQNFSNQVVAVEPPEVGNYGMAWQRFEAYLGVRWFM
jgi:hypothetical protein